MSQRSSDLKAASRTFGREAADSAYVQHAETEQESSARDELQPRGSRRGEPRVFLGGESAGEVDSVGQVLLAPARRSKGSSFPESAMRLRSKR